MPHQVSVGIVVERPSYYICLQPEGIFWGISGYQEERSYEKGHTERVVYLTFGLKAGSPEEAVHYLQYGMLSLLLYRAFTHRVRDYSIYAAVIIAGTMVGMVDETVQWLTPGRHFGVRDIWLNFTAVALVQAAWRQVSGRRSSPAGPMGRAFGGCVVWALWPSPIWDSAISTPPTGSPGTARAFPCSNTWT